MRVGLTALTSLTSTVFETCPVNWVWVRDLIAFTFALASHLVDFIECGAVGVGATVWHPIILGDAARITWQEPACVAGRKPKVSF